MKLVFGWYQLAENLIATVPCAKEAKILEKLQTLSRMAWEVRASFEKWESFKKIFNFWESFGKFVRNFWENYEKFAESGCCGVLLRKIVFCYNNVYVYSSKGLFILLSVGTVCIHIDFKSDRIILHCHITLTRILYQHVFLQVKQHKM